MSTGNISTIFPAIGGVPVTVGTQELLTFCTPGGRQFRFMVMITDDAILCCCCCHVNVSENKTWNHISNIYIAHVIL
jgi:hypothetical protein